MREFLNCDINTAEKHVEELMEEITQRNPAFSAGLTDKDTLIYGLEIKLTTYCNLRCRDCSHLIPYVPTPTHFSVDQMLGCLKKILHGAKIGVLILLGGELFLHPELNRLIAGLSELENQDRIGMIRVTTNGTMEPSDEFCAHFRKLPFSYVSFSNYGALSVKQTQAVQKLSDHEISYVITPFENQWRDSGDFSRRDYTCEEVKQLYKVCHGKTYMQLFNGHLYHCFRIPVLNEFAMIPPSGRDYLDIHNMTQEEINEALSSFCSTETYMEGCYYCDGSHPANPSIPAAIQLDGKDKQV